MPLELKVKIIKGSDEPGVQTTLGAYYDFITYLNSNAKGNKIDASVIEYYREHFRGSGLFREFLDYLVTEEGVKMVNVEYNEELEKSVLKEETIQEMIISMEKNGITVEMIAKIVDYSVDQVNTILQRS